MPNKTPNLNLNVWLENEVVNFEQINENFETLDDYVIATSSGEIRSNYDRGDYATALWRWREYPNGTIEAITKLEFHNLPCRYSSVTPAVPPYYSDDVTLYLPFLFTNIFDVQLNLASNTIGWAANITAEAVLDRVRFRVLNVSPESVGTSAYKQVFVSIKGGTT